MYNRKNGTSYFALYSTEDDDAPTILYASIGDLAETEYDFVIAYIKSLESESDDRRPKTFNRIFSRLKSTLASDILIVDMMWAEESILNLFKYTVENPESDYLQLYKIAYKIALTDGTLNDYSMM